MMSSVLHKIAVREEVVPVPFRHNPCVSVFITQAVTVTPRDHDPGLPDADWSTQ
jgi:hypothetical protein